MADTLSQPFRMDLANSRFSVLEQDSDLDNAQQIRAFLLTHKGERPILRAYGLDDPAFGDFDAGTFIEGFTDYYPVDDVEITDVRVGMVEGAVADVAVEYL